MTTPLFLPTFVTMVTGIWLDRNQLCPDSHDSTITITPSPEVSYPSINSQKDSSKSSSSSSSGGQLLQGAWGSSTVTAATMIKKTIGQTVLPSRPTTLRGNSIRGSDTSSSGSSTPQRYPSNNDLRLSLAKAGNPWKPKPAQDLSRSRSSDENKLTDGQRQGKVWPSGGGGAGKRGTDKYYRSVSDSTCVQGVGQRYNQSGQGRGGNKTRGTRKPSSSEPLHKRK